MNDCQILKSQETSAAKTIEIKRTPPDTPVYRTGNSSVKNCIVVLEMIGSEPIISKRYLPVKQSLLNDLHRFVQPILFQEVVTHSGERFAHPLSLLRKYIMTDWSKSELTLFSGALDCWITVEYCREEDGYTCTVEPLDKIESYDPITFTEELEEALSTDVIDSIEHPALQRLLLAESRDYSAIQLENWIEFYQNNETA